MAVLLILVMNGLFAAGGRQIVAYIDYSGADLFIAQAGVRNMHMASSVLQPAALSAVRTVPEVARAEGIAYFTSTLEHGGDSATVYVVGVAPDAEMGVPWAMAQGSPAPGLGEIVIPDRQWGAATPGPGETVSLGGRTLTVVGLASGTKIMASSIVFVNLSDALTMRRTSHLNYVLARVTPGADVSRVAADIAARVPGVTVLTRNELSRNDLDIAVQMGLDVLRIMATVGFVIGLSVTTLTVYVATVEQIRQFGILKALGAGSAHLFAAVFVQALLATWTGFMLGLGATMAVAGLAPALVPGLAVDLSLSYAARVLGYVTLMGLLAAIPPFLRIQSVEPVQIFRA